ncbi:MAG: hypothetical protein RIQ99_449 [Pseudomonadota bacterium]|jgi:acid phosphatase (class A)
MNRTIASLLLATVIVTPAFGSAATPSAPPVAPVSATAPAAANALEYLNPADFEPVRLLPAPAARGSAAEARELAFVHALINSASPQRLQQAKWDADHEDPAIFNEVIGRDLTKLPHTWALLTLIQNEASIAAGFSKKYFNRTRPWGADSTIPNCEGPSKKLPLNSYPSGHSTLSYSVGYALAQFMPDKAAAILSKAADYAESREYCGQHYASDTAASQVLGTTAAIRLLNDPRLADQIAAARAELSSI